MAIKARFLLLLLLLGIVFLAFVCVSSGISHPCHEKRLKRCNSLNEASCTTNVVPIVRDGLRDVRRKKSKKKKMSVHGKKNLKGEKGVARRAKGRKRNDIIVNLDVKWRKLDNNNAPDKGSHDVKREKRRNKRDSGSHEVRGSKRNNNSVNLDVKKKKKKRDNINAPDEGNHDVKGEKRRNKRDSGSQDVRGSKRNKNSVNLDFKKKKRDNVNAPDEGNHDVKGEKRGNKRDSGSHDVLGS